jgi:hypothetical protein
MRVLSAELKLKRQIEELRGIISEKLTDVHEHWEDLSDDKWPMVDKKGRFVVDSKIEVPDAGCELVFDIPALALIEDADFRTGEGAGVV